MMTEDTQSDELHSDIEELEHYRATGTDGRGSLQQLAAERIAAHRRRRLATQAAATAEATTQVPSQPATNQAAQLQAAIEARHSLQDDPAARVRETVAARYRESQSYREYLAVESARALDRARAEAEVAQRRADAMAEAQQQLLKELDAWKAETRQAGSQQAESQQSDAPLAVAPTLQPTLVPSLRVIAEAAPPSEPSSAPVAMEPAASLSVQLFEALTLPEPIAAAVVVPFHEIHEAEDTQSLATLDEALAFRVDPDFSDHRIEIVPIQANILQFPRELVAPRKARPRLAEGPLRSDPPAPADAHSSHAHPAQLRIFEVTPVGEVFAVEGAKAVEEMPADSAVSLPWLEPLAASPAVYEPAPELQPYAASIATPETMLGDVIAAPGWQGTLPAEAPARLPEAWPEHWPEGAPSLLMPVYAAAVERRLLCAIVDGCAVAAACVTLVTTTVLACGANVPHYPLLVMIPGLVFAAVAVAALYHWLFFTFSAATPGMRYARLSLCTFHDMPPSRRERQGRVLALLLAALPLGWGLVSLAFEIDHLGWHDKRSRMYPREY